jgi:hypothetical protein
MYDPRNVTLGAFEKRKKRTEIVVVDHRHSLEP